MQLSIIIVNFRSSRLIADCLHSIYSDPANQQYEILIIDNDSGDDSYEYIISRFPNISWTQMAYNAGFARANNAGIKKATGNVVLLLNPDTIVPKGAISACFDQFTNSEYVACGVQLLNEDASPQISGNYIVTGGLNYLLPLPFVGNIVRTMAKVFGASAPHVASAETRIEVDWINGAFLMVKQTAIHQSGLLDEDFFLYAEEAEWCSRLKKVGRLCIFGDIKVYHLQGISANDAFISEGKGYYNLFDNKGRQIMLSNLVRIRKQYGIVWFLVILSVYTLTIPVFLAGLIIYLLFPKSKRKYHFSEYFGYVNNVFFVWSLTPKIILNRPYFYKAL